MVYEVLEKIRAERPLVHHITNWVTIYDCAQIVRVFGALPVMAHAGEESGDMAGIASALVLNIGTLTLPLVESMIIAGKRATEMGIPIVLDAVGVGATRLRDEKAHELIDQVGMTVIKGNTSEIARLAGMEVVTKGVEATTVNSDMVEVAKRLANSTASTIVVTGANDIVTDGDRIFIVANGHKMMGTVVGTGCMAASVIGAFTAVEHDYAFASASALACFGIAGELAAEKAQGPGSFKIHLFDEASRLDKETIERMVHIEQR